MKDRIATEYFSIIGCLQVKVESPTSISLENDYNEKCDLQFELQEQMSAWKEAIEANAK